MTFTVKAKKSWRERIIFSRSLRMICNVILKTKTLRFPSTQVRKEILSPPAGRQKQEQRQLWLQEGEKMCRLCWFSQRQQKESIERLSHSIQWVPFLQFMSRIKRQDRLKKRQELDSLSFCQSVYLPLCFPLPPSLSFRSREESMKHMVMTTHWHDLVFSRLCHSLAFQSVVVLTTV